MTARVEYETTLQCDIPKCRNSFRRPCRWEYTRKYAAVCGWVYSTIRGDFCPDHAKETEGR